MNDRVFIDTNIWVYAKIEGKEGLKHKKAVEFPFEIKRAGLYKYASYQ